MQRFRRLMGVMVFAATASLLGNVRGEDEAPPPNQYDGPTQVSPIGSGEPLLDLPPNLLDDAFKKYVDLNQLSRAYLTRDPSLITDVGLQLLEAERVLLRTNPHVTGQAVLQLAVRVATNQGDLDSLKRLELAANRIEDKSFAAQVKLAQQLAAAPRAETAPPPAVDDAVDPALRLKLEAQLNRLTRSLDTGDGAALKALHEEVKKSDIKGVPLQDYLVTETAAASGKIPAAGNDAVGALLSQLGSASRAGTVTGPHLETDPSGNVRRYAKAYYLDSARPNMIWIHFPERPQGGGWNEWVPKNSYYGLVGRYGNVRICTGEWIEGKNNQGKIRVRVKNFEGGYNPDWVEIEYWHEQKRIWFQNSFIGLKDAMTFTYDGDNETSRICNIVRGEGDTIKPAGLVNMSSNTLKVADPSKPVSLSIKPIPGPHPQDINRGAVTNPANGSMSGNIVAAGGGNAIERAAKIVAAGGGNIVAAGGGNIVAAGGGNLIGKGGAGLTVARSGQSGTAAARLSRSKIFAP